MINYVCLFISNEYRPTPNIVSIDTMLNGWVHLISSTLNLLKLQIFRIGAKHAYNWRDFSKYIVNFKRKIYIIVQIHKTHDISSVSSSKSWIFWWNSRPRTRVINFILYDVPSALLSYEHKPLMTGLLLCSMFLIWPAFVGITCFSRSLYIYGGH